MFYNIYPYECYRDEYERMIQEASKDLGLYLSHPVNEFLLIKRMFESSEFYNNNSSIGSKLPSKDDVSRASLSLLRLQKTYKLDTLHLGNRLLSGPNIQPRHSSNIQSNNKMNGIHLFKSFVKIVEPSYSL